MCPALQATARIRVGFCTSVYELPTVPVAHVGSAGSTPLVVTLKWNSGVAVAMPTVASCDGNPAFETLSLKVTTVPIGQVPPGQLPLLGGLATGRFTWTW